MIAPQELVLASWAFSAGTESEVLPRDIICQSTSGPPEPLFVCGKEVTVGTVISASGGCGQVNSKNSFGGY